MNFTKMHALGNDFIIIDAQTECIDNPPALAKTLCRRKFGIGSDQLLVLDVSNVADFKMRIFNPDGSEVEMCGNGIRCLAKYIWDRGLSKNNKLTIETKAGIIVPEKMRGMVRVDMGVPVFDNAISDYKINAFDREFKVTSVSMGNPHAVIFLNKGEVDTFDVGKYGSVIETMDMFPNRTNVEFVEVANDSEIKMRVWERGTGETTACGTGASASAAACIGKGLTGKSVTVHLAGGDLNIEWDGAGRLYMTGPAVEVFEGKIKQ